MSFIKPQRTFTLVSFAADSVRREGGAFVIVEVEYHHGTEATLAAFPSIDHTEVELFDGPHAFRFDDQEEAQQAFSRMSRDLAAAEAALPGSVDAVVRYVGRIPYEDGHMTITTSNSATGNADMHVFVDGRMINEPRPRMEMPK